MSYGFSVYTNSGVLRLGTTDTIYRLHSTYVVEFDTGNTTDTKYVSVPGYNPDSGEWALYYTVSRATSVTELHNEIRVDFDGSGSLTFGGTVVLKVVKK